MVVVTDVQVLWVLRARVGRRSLAARNMVSMEDRGKDEASPNLVLLQLPEGRKNRGSEELFRPITARKLPL